ncbi:E3 ubiquitin-protein ligase UPL3 -like protein [Gossypium arboreum]|uniref:Uncharacterized protein n=2 Tax=Gossypium arboreum TaxID=29729 RepID=A0ABR0PH49_GOSAR|nr:uncharacterized protein LOC108458171 [Gossypium arboreum]KAK5823744.1 hypothetical protein PVK06_018507 [Gossypium arboreum]KHG24600.1 E3 ubiquitin-protein ligase UPL3 -like protein [Gossypium arboreum]
MGTEKGTTYLLSSFFFSIILTIVCHRTVKAQSLPPAKYDGFLYTNHRVDSDTIMIEAFFDPVCPDSRDAWPPLKQAIHHYGSRVSLIVHLLPLPYHDYAFSTSRAMHIVNLLNPSATFRLLESFFEYQGRFYNAQTSNKSRDAVVDEIIKLAAETVGNSYYSAIESGFNDRKTDLKTRISFKYSASRGVFGTPTFYINGFAVPDSGSAIDYKQWRSFIDPLLLAQSRKRDNLPHLSL